MTYWRLHYHLIWGTNEREPSIMAEREKIFYGVLYNKGKEADCVRHLKGTSAHAINHTAGSDCQFKWQGGYGALTVGECSLETVMEYAVRQKERHRESRLIAVYERIEEES